MTKKETKRIAKKVWKVFLYIFATIALVKLLELAGIDLPEGESYIIGAVNIGLVVIKETFFPSQSS